MKNKFFFIEVQHRVYLGSADYWILQIFSPTCEVTYTNGANVQRIQADKFLTLKSNIFMTSFELYI